MLLVVHATSKCMRLVYDMLINHVMYRIYVRQLVKKEKALRRTRSRICQLKQNRFHSASAYLAMACRALYMSHDRFRLSVRL